MMGYRYGILPEGFLVHQPHVASKSKLAWRDGNSQLRATMDRLYPQFLEDLERKYSSRKESVVPVSCPKKKENQIATKKKDKKSNRNKAETGSASAADRVELESKAARTRKDSEVVEFSKPTRRNDTDTRINVTAPELYATVDVSGDSSTASVIAMGTGYEITVYQRFVGSLRKSGYRGHILLLVDDTITPETKRYFAYRNVTYRVVEMINSTQCISNRTKDLLSAIHDEKCVKEYPDLKARWARYPILRDMLQKCKECSGPVLYVDVRDTFFQRDPFGSGSPPIKGLHVYQEHKNHSTTHWFVSRPLQQCKGIRYNERNLCSGSTVGTKPAMLSYLEIMFEELKAWAKMPNCTFSDQPVHNYLYYSGQLPFATSIENQRGGIVNTVFHTARFIVARHTDRMGKLHLLPKKPKEARVYNALRYPFEGANGTRWIGESESDSRLIDDEGYFLEFDGTRSRVVHKYDRFGDEPGHFFYEKWLKHQDWLKDSVPVGWGGNASIV